MASLKALVSSVNFSCPAGAPSGAGGSGSNYVQESRRDAAADAARLSAAVRAAAASGGDEELCSALQEANAAASRDGGSRAGFILGALVPDICTGIAHPCRPVRNQAHVALLRLLRHAPGGPRGRQLTQAYAACLESGDPSVAQTALERLPDVALVAQESLSDIMGAAFNLGVHGNANVVQYVTEAIGLLNTQLGY